MKNIFKIKYLCVLLIVSAFYFFIGYNVFNFEEGRLSEEENRYLKKIPEINLDMLKNGSFSKEIESFLTDNVYNRKELISLAKKVKYYYSINNIIKDDTIIFINNDIHIKDDCGFDELENLSTNSNLISTNSSLVSTNSDLIIGSGIEDEVKNEDEYTIIGNIDEAEKGSYIYYNGEAYNVAHLSQLGRNNSIKTINKLKEMFDKKTFTVMVSPTKSGIITDEKVIDAIGNQAKEIENFVKKFKYSINTIDLTKTFIENKDEYIFYKSDHHWTELGAYYAYREYMKAMKRPYTELDKLRYEVMDENWKGVAYNVTKSERFKDLSDKVENYYSNKYCTMLTCYSSENYTMDYSTIPNNYSGYGSYCGVKGALKIINVPSNNKDDILLVTGDSFCDALVPILVENYGKIIYIDSRRANDDIYKVAMKFGVDLDDVKEVLVCCNFDSYNNTYVSSKMDYGFGLSNHTIYKTKEEYFDVFLNDLYTYLLNYREVVNVLHEKKILNVEDFKNSLRSIVSDMDYTKNTELIRAISSKISYNNDNNLELHERAYEESFLGYCLRNNNHLRLLNNIKDNIKYSMDTTKSIIKLYHNDNITFNLIK